VTAPVVSVVIPARDAAATLPAALAALRAQTLGAVEVLVVDDRSTGSTAALAEAAGARVLRVATGGDGGPGAARNLGVAAARADLVAFTDADCRPAPDWLERGVAALRAGADLVQGRVVPDPAAELGPFDRTVHVERPSPLYETANLLVTRDAFDRAGGFPPIAPLGLPAGEKSFGEDTLFGWAVRRSGASVAFAPDAVVHHAVFARDARGFVAERRRLRFFPHLVGAVPELRAHLPGRVFLTRRAAAFDLAVLGLVGAAATRRPALALLAAPYALLARPGWPPAPWRVRRLAAGVAADAVGLASLVEGSVRARTPVL